jgi:hypothetical protein
VQVLYFVVFVCIFCLPAFFHLDQLFFMCGVRVVCFLCEPNPVGVGSLPFQFSAMSTTFVVVSKFDVLPVASCSEFFH